MRLVRKHFPLFLLCQGSFLIFCPFFTHMDFLKAFHSPFVIAETLAPLGFFLSTVRKLKGHGCDIPLKLCVWELLPNIFSLRLASADTITKQQKYQRVTRSRLFTGRKLTVLCLKMKRLQDMKSP